MQTIPKTMSLPTPKRKTAPISSESPEFERLFEQHWQRLCTILYRITGDEQEAQDLALETFLRLHCRPPKEATNLGGWLYRVATNLAFNELRSKKRRSYYEAESAKESMLQDSSADVEEYTSLRMEHQRVRQVLGSMKPRFARLLVLRYSGLTYAELSEAVGVRKSSVGTLLARAEKEFERLYLLERSDHDAS